MKVEPAVRAYLSPATIAVLSRSGVTLVRGREAFTLDDRELARLVEAREALKPKAAA